jgi:hypothetical protein
MGLSLAGSLGMTALALTGGPAPVAASVPMSDVLEQASGYVGVREVVNDDGTVTDTYRNPSGAEVRVSGPRGMRIRIGPTVVSKAADGTAVHTQSVAARPPAIDKSSPGAADRAIAAYEAAGRSVVKDAIHNGMDPAAAQRLHGGSGATSSITATTASEVRLVGPNAVANGTIMMSWCADYQSSDGKAHGHACDIQKMDQDLGGGDWYLVDEQTASGWSTDTSLFPKRLTQLAQWVAYPSGNTIVSWRPNGTQTIGQCQTVTSGISSPKTGLNYSVSTNICPDNFGVYTITALQFGARWNGHEPSANYYEGSDGVDEVHSPPSAADSPSLSVHIQW